MATANLGVIYLWNVMYLWIIREIAMATLNLGVVLLWNVTNFAKFHQLIECTCRSLKSFCSRQSWRKIEKVWKKIIRIFLLSTERKEKSR